MLLTTLFTEEFERARSDYATANTNAARAMKLETYPFGNYEEERINNLHANPFYPLYDTVRGVGRKVKKIFDNAKKDIEAEMSDDATVQMMEYPGTPVLLGATKDTILSLLRK